MTSAPHEHGALRRLAALFGGGARPRKARLYCVGAPRTGTHSVAALFDRAIRARHEPQLRRAMRAVVQRERGAWSSDQLRAFVRARDARLRLDVDSSHVNAFLAPALLAEFDDARFLLTIRDCYSWLDSALNHTVNTGSRSAVDRSYLELWFGAEAADASPHDAFLRERGLLSVDRYLSAWTRHNEQVLRAVPADRLLVVPTQDLGARREEIAAFAGIDRAHLAPGFRAQGEARQKHGLFAQIDRGFLEERAAARCGELMRRFFPDVTLPA